MREGVAGYGWVESLRIERGKSKYIGKQGF
jgi:hypothetical protein